MVRNLSSRTRLVREYLAQNVIEDLPSQLRQFLLDTCVLGRLSGPLCDEFLGRSGTATLLEEIERRHIFLSSLDDGTTYRYHEVLRSHLESLLIDGVGDRRVRERYREAGRILEAAGACSEALLAYCRAGDESAALRLLSRAGAEVADDPGSWLDLLPVGVVDHDPWLILAAARRHLSAGRWRQALACYQRLDSSSPGSVAHTYQPERRTLTMWLEPVMPASADWIGILCQATRKDPLAARQAAARMAGPTGQVAAGMASLLAGQVADARQLWQRAAEDVDSSSVISAAARLAAGIAELLTGAPSPSSDLHIGRERAEGLGLSWLARLASCAEQCLSLGVPAESDAAVAACLEAEDLWGAALILLLQGFGWLRQPDMARVRFLESARLFRQLGAGVLEAWARAGAAVAATRANDPDANELAAEAESVARTTSTWGALMAVCDLFRRTDPRRAGAAVSQAKQLGAEGIAQLSSPSQIVLGGDRTMPGAALTCLGDFNLVLRGTKVNLGEVKPRVRSLIRLLALHTGRAVHRETLIEALWPGGTGSTGTRNLQVAVSAARQLLERTESGTAMILREGDAYRLALPERADVDLINFERAMERSSRARARGDGQAMRAALARCLDLYNGDVLAVEGPAEWVLEIRDRYRLLAVEAAEALAELNFGANDFPDAARACERGLNIDRYQDRLWRIRVEALERAGDLAAASLARRSYNEVLADLGLSSVDKGRLGAAS
jgi:DNA-binding SARP family transcriptional activator/tetratricopeptide (TPR) repeat protein